MPENERINSPEQLNEYIRVTTPGTWLILGSILVFFEGFFIWIFTGSLEVSSSSYVYSHGGKSVAFLPAGTASKLKAGMTVRLPETEATGKIGSVGTDALTFDEMSAIVGDNNVLMMGINGGDRMIQVDAEIPDAPQGVSRSVFVMDSVSPLSFLFR